MGKGYNNFMSKKAFHPGSYANQKRIKEAEEKEAARLKHEEETLAQYRKEQELFQQKSLVSRESKDKLSLSFMYEGPPGTSQVIPKKETDGDPVAPGTLVWKRKR
jgi:CBF1 interacting corepressor